MGCKVNKYDTDALLAKLAEAGVLIQEFNQLADIYIINTCTVTNAGDKKSLQIIRRARRQNPAAFIAVCGCMPRGQASSTGKISDAGADFIFDTRKPEDLLAKLEEVFPGRVGCQNEHFTNKQPGYSSDKITGLETDMHVSGAAQRTRAFIKIQDGCNRYCAYCIVPYVRGPVVSRPTEDILAEAAMHIRHGIKEIVLTGIQVAAYGYDTDSENINLPRLINHLNDLGPKRLRLSSLDPCAVDSAFLETVSNSPTLCDHFHLSLQSGADKTLASMNRRYTTADYATAASKLKNLRPEMALTTDIIVGFPGESDEDFSKSLRFANDMGFSRIHVFEYSPRDGTPAADMPGQIPARVKSARGEEMRALAKSLELKFLHSQIGKLTPVLFESKIKESINSNSSDTWQGHTGNYCNVKVQGTNLTNQIKHVQITGATQDGLTGELVNIKS